MIVDPHLSVLAAWAEPFHCALTTTFQPNDWDTIKGTA